MLEYGVSFSPWLNFCAQIDKRFFPLAPSSLRFNLIVLIMFQKIHQVANRWCPKCWLSKKFPRRIPAQPSLQGLPLLVPCQPTAAKLPSQAPASTRTWSQSRLWPLPKYDCWDVLSYFTACLIAFAREDLLIKQMCIIEITPVHWPGCIVACSKSF